METKKKADEVFMKSIRRLTAPIFSKVLQEDVSSSMTTTQNTFSIAFRPNNYRREIAVKIKSNSTIKKVKSAISAIPNMIFNYNHHTKMVSVKNYQGITIQYGKNTLTGIYAQARIGNDKTIYKIERDSLDEIDARIDEIREDIRQKIDAALLDFSTRFKINLPIAKPSWSRFEDFVKGEEYLDNIPEDTIIHDTHFKKVYGKGIEFIGKKGEHPTSKLKNYIRHRAVEKIAPQIADEIKDLKDTIYSDLNPILKEFTKQLQLHLLVQENTLKTNKATQKTMNLIQKGLINKAQIIKSKKRVKKYGLTKSEMGVLRKYFG